MTKNISQRSVGKISLGAAFIGLGLGVTAIGFTLFGDAPRGSWAALGLGLTILYLLCASMIFTVIFGITALMQYRRYRNDDGVRIAPARMALKLHISAVLVAVVGYALFVMH